MDILEYAKENFFNYTVDIPSAEYARRFLKGRGYPAQAKEVVIIIVDRNEDPEALRSTVTQLAMTNVLTEVFHRIDKKHFRVKGIIVGDQSDFEIARINKGLLYTVRDVLYSTLGKPNTPDIHHLRFDTDMAEIAYEYLRDYLRISRHDKGKPLLGKGTNMAITSLVSSDPTEGGISDDHTVLIYMDAENKEANYRDPFLLGLPLIYEGSPVLFTKAAFKRYHMERERRTLGGRVNASLGVPLINMLRHKGLVLCKKPIVYPLSGEIGIDRSLFWSIRIAKKYGVETTTLLQLLGRDEKGDAKLSEESFLQVDLGINMDQPLAEGKPPKEILRSVRRMSEDIVSSTFEIMGKQIREAWGSSEGFVKMFRQFQKHSIERWMQSHDTGLITGGVTHQQLRRAVYSVVKVYTENSFAGEGFMRRVWRRWKRTLRPNDEGFIPPILKIRDSMGGKFEELRERLLKQAERID